MARTLCADRSLKFGKCRVTFGEALGGLFRRVAFRSSKGAALPFCIPDLQTFLILFVLPYATNWGSGRHTD